MLAELARLHPHLGGTDLTPPPAATAGPGVAVPPPTATPGLTPAAPAPVVAPPVAERVPSEPRLRADPADARLPAPDPAVAPADTGLARRVRGANMPDTAPRTVRRSGPGGPVPPLGVPPADPRSAEDVYGFLANFTSGVQRGLDDTGRTRRGD
jgi:hypothetical protein